MKSVATGLVVLSSALAVSAAVPLYGQCGGNNYTGETACVSGAQCVFQSEWYSQCLPGTATSSTRTSTSTRASSTSTTSSSTSTRASSTSTLSSTRASTSTAPAPTGSVPVDQLVGYGVGTTGGGNASPQTVTSCSALASAVASTSAAVIRINGYLSGCGIMDIESNKSIIGVGSNSGLTGGGFRVRRASNVIIRNLVLHVAPPKGDLLALDNATQVWIDHCDLSSVGYSVGKDDYDGLLDISHASNFVTVSWTKFHDHWKGSLIGHSDNNASEDTGTLKVTYHHNEFVNVNSRLPSLRFGTAHIYNSVYRDVPTSAINSRMGAQVLVESNFFNNVQLAIVTDLDSDEEGYAVERNNLFTNSTTRITQTGSFNPPYSYTLDPVGSVASIVSSKAGAGIISV